MDIHKVKARRQHAISVANEIPTQQIRSALTAAATSLRSLKRMAQMKSEGIMVKVMIKKSKSNNKNTITKTTKRWS